MPNICITLDGKVFQVDSEGSLTQAGSVAKGSSYTSPDGKWSISSKQLDDYAKVSKPKQDKPAAKRRKAVTDSQAQAAALEPMPAPKPEPKPQPSADVNLKPLPVDGTENWRQWVDLGLPSGTRWATSNIGATAPEGLGDYFAWGSTSPNALFHDSFANPSDYEAKGISTLAECHDAAKALWRGEWRMPTVKEFRELINHCDWEWTDRAGTKGYMVRSRVNDAAIFLPAAGCHTGGEPAGIGSYGVYWTASINTGSSLGLSAYALESYPSKHAIKEVAAHVGRSIRPVLPKQKRRKS